MTNTPQHWVKWYCLSCEGEPVFEHDEFVEHVRVTHGIPSSAKGQRRMLQHMDGRDFYGSRYEWTIGTIKAIEDTHDEREADDPFRYF